MHVAKLITTSVTGIALAFSMLASTLPANAATSGFHAAYFTESDFQAKAPGQTGQFSVAYTNMGDQSWVKGAANQQANLATAAPLDNTTDFTAGWSNGWLSANRYTAQDTALVAPGQATFFIYNITVPAGAAAGEHRFFGRPVIDGVTFMEDFGYYQSVNVTLPPPPPAPGTIALSSTPTSPSANTTPVISGTGATAASTVTVSEGTTALCTATASSTGTFSCTTSALAIGSHTIGAADGTGRTATTLTYVVQGPAPTVTSLSPNTGPSAGGTTVTIAGAGFTCTTNPTVNFGAANPATVTSCGATTLTVTSPAGAAGAASVTVANAGGAASAAQTFTYLGTAPVLTSLNPSTGPSTGGTSVVIAGSGFTCTTLPTVNFGTTAATVTSCGATTLTAGSPAGAAGAASVTVNNAGGAASNALTFTYTAPAGPVLTSLTPNSGTSAGGTSVVIAGTGFTCTTSPTVNFGAANPATVTSCSATSLTTTSPAGAIGAVSVTATNAGSAASNALTYTYTGTIGTIGTITPTNGPTFGGNSVTINGTGFTCGTTATPVNPTVNFGTAAGTVTTCSTTALVVTAPAGTGTVQVTETNQGGSASNGVAYTYNAAPTFTAISTTAGSMTVKATFSAPICRTAAAVAPGDFTATINGTATAITDAIPACNATFSNAATTANLTLATATVAGDTVVVTLTPTGGAKIQDANGNTVPSQSRSTTTALGAAPTISSVTPATGPSNGGTTVTITGTGFTATSVVAFGGTPATAANTTFVSSTSLTAVTPEHVAGTFNVTVTNADGQVATAPNAFTYTAPVITAFAPTTGTTATVTYDQPVSCNNAPSAAMQFVASPTGGGTILGATIACTVGPAGSKTVTLTFATAIATTTTGGSLTYTKDATPADNIATTTLALQKAVSPQTIAYTSLATPAMTGAQASGGKTTVFVTYNTPLNGLAILPAQFTVCQTANLLLCYAVSAATETAAGSTVVTLTTAVLPVPGTSLTVKYTADALAANQVTGADAVPAKTPDSTTLVLAP